MLFEVCHTIIRKIEKEISDYKNQVTPNPNLESGPFKKFIDIKQDTFKLKDEIEKYEDELSIQMLSISSRLKLQTIKQQSEIKLNLFRQQLAKIEHTLNGE